MSKPEYIRLDVTGYKEIPKPRSGDWVWTVSEPKVEVLDNFYFQFPQDNEIEVSP